MKTRIFLLLALLTTTFSFATGIIQDTGLNLEAYVTDFVTFVGATVLVVDLLKAWLLKKVSGKVLQFVSWTVGVVIAFAAYFLKIGFIAEFTEIWQVGVVGLGAALASNGIANTGLISSLLGLVGVPVKKKDKDANK